MMMMMTTAQIDLFHVFTIALAAAFVYFGMDVRPRPGTMNLAGRGWQALMKFSSFALIVVVFNLAVTARQIGGLDWAGLALMATGTAIVTAAKRTLGRAHTFTGQCLKNPRLVTRGVYALT